MTTNDEVNKKLIKNNKKTINKFALAETELTVSAKNALKDKNSNSLKADNKKEIQKTEKKTAIKKITVKKEGKEDKVTEKLDTKELEKSKAKDEKVNKKTTAKKETAKKAEVKEVEKKPVKKEPNKKVVAKQPVKKVEVKETEKKPVKKEANKKVVAKQPVKKVAAKQAVVEKVEVKQAEKKPVKQEPNKKVVAKQPIKKVEAKQAIVKKTEVKEAEKKPVKPEPNKKVVAKQPAKQVETKQAVVKKVEVKETEKKASPPKETFEGKAKNEKFQSKNELAIKKEDDKDSEKTDTGFLTEEKFSDFNLPPEILKSLNEKKFIYCTKIQAQSFPVSLKGKDVNGQAQTGTGKTIAFLVPLVARLLERKPLEEKLPRALVVLPTRELAQQVYEEAKLLTKFTKLNSVLIIGGLDYKKQAERLKKAPEIIIATPGRIIDYLKQNIFVPTAIEIVVLDEADRLLDMGFVEDLKYLLSKLPSFKIRQTLLFSATLDDRVESLIYKYSNPPVTIETASELTNSSDIEQEIYHVGLDDKFTLLLGLLKKENCEKILIFANTRAFVDKLVKKLRVCGFAAAGITGDLPQKKRNRLMESFKDDSLKILVATDVASRGIHVDNVSHVFNYDLPQEAENYIHRIGRTARAGKNGKAISFGCEDYIFHLEDIEKLLGNKIPVVWPDDKLFRTDLINKEELKTFEKDKKKKKEYSKKPAPKRYKHIGPSQSSRPGGVFGLAPLNPSNADVEYSETYKLNWDFSSIFNFDEVKAKENIKKPYRKYRKKNNTNSNNNTNNNDTKETAN